MNVDFKPPCPVCGHSLLWEEQGERFCCEGSSRHSFISEGWGAERFLVLVGAIVDSTGNHFLDGPGRNEVTRVG